MKLTVILKKLIDLKQSMLDSTGGNKAPHQRSASMFIGSRLNQIPIANPFKETYEEEKKSIDTIHTVSENIPGNLSENGATYVRTTGSGLSRKKRKRKVRRASKKNIEPYSEEKGPTIVLHDKPNEAKILNDTTGIENASSKLNSKLNCCNNSSCACALF